MPMRTEYNRLTVACLSRGPAFVIALMSVILAGCFHKASLGVWQASETSLPGSGRVALVGVDADRNDQVARLLDERLDSFANWEVCSAADIPQTTPEQVAPASVFATGVQLVSGQVSSPDERSIETLVHSASAADVELLISAAVREASILAPSKWNPLGDQDTYAKVTLQLAAYATESDEARVSETISKMMKVPAGTTEISDGTFSHLSSIIVDEFLTRFQPRNASVKLNLASPPVGQRGRRAVRLGNTEAHRGRWDRAAAFYREALGENPDCDAACYNLALAAVADRRFTDAQNLARQAMLMRHDPIYVEGLHAIHELAREDRKVRYQIGE